MLPPGFTEDPERLTRFEREAQLLAQLQHPNIASIYGLKEADGTTALVMELVEGSTLAERIEQGAIPLQESLEIAGQIATALEAAHEKGIVHRDLKPQNIKAPRDGQVKILDFGLSKAMDPTSDPSSADSASQLAAETTLTLGATVQGMIPVDDHSRGVRPDSCGSKECATQRASCLRRCEQVPSRHQASGTPLSPPALEPPPPFQ